MAHIEQAKCKNCNNGILRLRGKPDSKWVHYDTLTMCGANRGFAEPEVEHPQCKTKHPATGNRCILPANHTTAHDSTSSKNDVALIV